MSKELVKTDLDFPALRQELSAEIFSEVLAPGETLDIFSLPRLKVPSGGGLAWEMPDGSVEKEIQGIIILRQPVRAYWRESLSEGSAPPDCASPDTLNGIGEPGGACVRCPNSAWGSATGIDGQQRRGQACRLVTRLFILTRSYPLPLYLPLPPSSQKAAKSYVVDLLVSNEPYWKVITSLSLQRTQNREGIAYSAVTFQRVASVLPDMQDAITAYRSNILPTLKDIPITTTDADEIYT